MGFAPTALIPPRLTVVSAQRATSSSLAVCACPRSNRALQSHPTAVASPSGSNCPCCHRPTASPFMQLGIVTNVVPSCLSRGLPAASRRPRSESKRSCRGDSAGSSVASGWWITATYRCASAIPSEVRDWTVARSSSSTTSASSEPNPSRQSGVASSRSQPMRSMKRSSTCLRARRRSYTDCVIPIVFVSLVMRLCVQRLA